MKLKDVVAIVLEEREKHKDPLLAVPHIQTRIATSIAERIILPTLTPEKWELFLGLIRGEPLFHQFAKGKDGDIIVMDVPKVFDAFRALEDAYSFLLNGFEDTTRYFQNGWSKDAILETMCSFSVERDRVMDEYKEKNRISLHSSRGKLFVIAVRWGEIGLAGEVPVNDFVQEMASSCVIAREILRS